MGILYRILAIFIIFSCFGCHNNKLFLKTSGEESVNDIFNYYEEVKIMSNIEIKNEYKNKEHLYMNEKSKENALKFVFLMISPTSEFYNSHRAAYILDELIMKSGSDKDLYKNIAMIIRDMIVVSNKKDFLHEEANKRLDNIISEKQEKDFLYQEMNKKIVLIMEEYEKKDILNKKLNEEITLQRLTVERLQKKIEELKEIEKSINERKNSKGSTT